MTLGSSCTGLGGHRDSRGTDLSLEEPAHLSNEVSLSPVSVIVPDRSANPFHMSGDVDFFLLRDQKRNKSHSVSIQDQGLPPALASLTQGVTSQISKEHFSQVTL